MVRFRVGLYVHLVCFCSFCIVRLLKENATRLRSFQYYNCEKITNTLIWMFSNNSQAVCSDYLDCYIVVFFLVAQ